MRCVPLGTEFGLSQTEIIIRYVHFLFGWAIETEDRVLVFLSPITWLDCVTKASVAFDLHIIAVSIRLVISCNSTSNQVETKDFRLVRYFLHSEKIVQY